MQFSLRDVLSLTTIIAVATALLLLWIENTGCETHGTQCKNNLRNLAMAANLFEDAAGKYPGRLQTLGARPVPWVVTVLPQIERLDLYDYWMDATIATKPTPYLDVLACPKDHRTPRQPQLSYVANAGVADLGRANRANGVFLDLTNADVSSNATGEQIVDGLSQTLLLSENLQATTWNSTQPYDTIFLWHPTTHPSNDMRINGGDTKSPVNVATARPSSRHPGGVNVAFADYHVIFLNEKIDYRVYMQLMTPNDKDSDMPQEWRNIPLDEKSYR